MAPYVAGRCARRCGLRAVVPPSHRKCGSRTHTWLDVRLFVVGSSTCINLANAKRVKSALGCSGGERRIPDPPGLHTIRCQHSPVLPVHRRSPRTALLRQRSRREPRGCWDASATYPCQRRSLRICRWTGCHRCDGRDRRAGRCRQPDRRNLALDRVLRTSGNRQPRWGQLRVAVPGSELRPELSVGMGSFLRIHLVACRYAHADAHTPWRDAQLDGRRSLAGFPLSHRPPGIRGRPRGHILSPGTAVPALVDSDTTGGCSPSCAPKRADINIRTSTLDAGRRRIADLAGLARCGNGHPRCPRAGILMRRGHP